MHLKHVEDIKCPYVQSHNNCVYIVVGHCDWYDYNIYKGIC